MSETEYQLHFIRPGKTRIVNILAVNDEDAMMLADLSHDGVDIEIRQGDRLIGRIERDGPHTIMRKWLMP